MMLLFPFFQMVAGTLHRDHTCSLLQTRIQPSKANIPDRLQTHLLAATTTDKEYHLGSNYSKTQNGARCDAGHYISERIRGFSNASAKCDADPKCAGFENIKCKNDQFRLCAVGTLLVYDFYLYRYNMTARRLGNGCVHVKKGMRKAFQWLRGRAVTNESYSGDSGRWTCDAQHWGNQNNNLESVPRDRRYNNGTGLTTEKEKWTLAEAQKRCDENPSCAAVRDFGCDNKGRFQFCTVGFQKVRSRYTNGPQADSCIYTKKEVNATFRKAAKAQAYSFHKDQQCDVHHTGAAHQSWDDAKAACDQDSQCSGLLDTQCNGWGFIRCSKGFTMIPTPLRGQGCVYTKPGWSPVKWTKSSSGCPCYFDENRTDCACCSDGACQCSRSLGANRCAPCNAIQKCIVSEDLNDFPNLMQKVSPALLARLNDVLEARTYESRQSGIRGFLKAAYELPSSTEKLQAVALLDAKLNRENSGDTAFEFPNAEEVEDWLASWFLEDEIWEHATDASTQNKTQYVKGLPIIKGLRSRGALIQEKFQQCDWQTALQQFYATQGGYGNWCGKSPPGSPGLDNQMVSYGACNGGNAKKGTWGLEVCNDSGFDDACSRHDQGAYTTDIFGIATKSLCKVDADFKAARVKLGIQSGFQDGMKRSEKGSIVAANCLFDMMPCMRYEEKSYWDWCSTSFGGYPCKKTTVGYITHWPMGNYSQFKDSACGPPGCYSESKTNAKEAISAQ
eukprot:gnl/MRDRNA2_/MRDRNA2_82119_c0_seq2.p1 gnl/MRDRNA2_/MRDRNA2_82119_c0~~gnl/MRDRNA2_/MRDRNA2_82119_c0_seq2.p1  ORF type:complete len:729 (+),score=97.84 gnl/MRDRNA2_/MRDRNA2_82119_c0_seq2:139-2325(+)